MSGNFTTEYPFGDGVVEPYDVEREKDIEEEDEEEDNN